MKIAIGQIHTRLGDFDQAAERIVMLSQQMASEGAELLVVAPAATSGLTTPGNVRWEGFMTDLQLSLWSIAARLSCPVLVTCMTPIDMVATPCATLIANGEVTPIMGGLSAGLSAPCARIQIGTTRLALTYGEEGLNELCDGGKEQTDVVLYMPITGLALDEPLSMALPSAMNGRLSDTAQITKSWVVRVGSLGLHDGEIHYGSSLLISPHGEVKAVAPAFEEATPLWEVGVEEDPLNPLMSGYTRTQPPHQGEMLLTLWWGLCMGLESVVAAEGRERACMVLQDDIASLLLCVALVDALGPTRVHVLLAHTGVHEHTQAWELVQALHLPQENIHQRAISHEGSFMLTNDIAQAYVTELARELNALVVDPIDKTVLSLAGMQGALAADLLPFADLYRSDLIDLRRMRNTVSPVLPEYTEGQDLGELTNVAHLAEDMRDAKERLSCIDEALFAAIQNDMAVSDLPLAQDHPEVAKELVARLFAPGLRRPCPSAALMFYARSVWELRGRGFVWADRPRPESERLQRDVPTSDPTFIIPSDDDFFAYLDGFDTDEQGGK